MKSNKEIETNTIVKKVESENNGIVHFTFHVEGDEKNNEIIHFGYFEKEKNIWERIKTISDCSEWSIISNDGEHFIYSGIINVFKYSKIIIGTK
ncbi:hypothetical protein [Bacillus salitolerans]|uniref:hypothetical protein n=1 Tax=Bacillus salitolerans TaxID=1437434 RepID=UPI00366BA889